MGKGGGLQSPKWTEISWFELLTFFLAGEEGTGMYR